MKRQGTADDPLIMDAWEIVLDTSKATSYTAPELIPHCLRGQVIGHPRSTHRDDIEQTVIISGIKGKRGDLVVTGSDQYYKLGLPSPEYLEQFPETSVEGLLKNLTELGEEAPV